MFRKKSQLEELVEYLKKNIKKGYTKESLRWALINQGYSKLEVEKALRKLDLDLSNEAPLLKTKPVIKYEIVEPKDYAQKEKRSFWSFLRRLFG